MKTPLKSLPGDWKRSRANLHIESAGPFRRVFLHCNLQNDHRIRENTRILFFSDLHIRPQQVVSRFPASLRWYGTEKIRDFLMETIEIYQPQHLFFGGDMMAFLSCLPECLKLFCDLKVPGRKIGVYGNWDLMRKWLPSYIWRKIWQEEAGLELLINERRLLKDDLTVSGLDDCRKGSPVYTQKKNRNKEILLVHNPDTIPRFFHEEFLSDIGLILCGHTHGGQFRIPFFGAVETSSCFGKTFEYGLYQHCKTGTLLYVTAGIGTTFIHKRFFCPPECVILDISQN